MAIDDRGLAVGDFDNLDAPILRCERKRRSKVGAGDNEATPRVPTARSFANPFARDKGLVTMAGLTRAQGMRTAVR
jgi:hypothetical protein